MGPRIVVTTVALVLACLSSPAQAAFPGQNGKIAYERGGDIWVMNPDGTGQTNITNTDGEVELNPAWSPDGTKIAFRTTTTTRREGIVWSMNANGTDRFNLTASYVTPCEGNCLTLTPSDVDWAPDGTKLVFTNFNRPCDESIGSLATVNADGTGVTSLVCHASTDDRDWDSPSWSPNGKTILFDGPRVAEEPDVWAYETDGSGVTLLAGGANNNNRAPDWSADNSKIAFDSAASFDSSYRVTVMNPDGTGKTPITGFGFLEHNPSWSPDSSLITFHRDGDIWKMKADGTGQVNLTNTAVTEDSPSWQPIPINSYPRPKGATPFRTSLAIAYEPCSAPDRTHGPPLAFPSCASPEQASDHLTVGTADANAQPALNEGSVRFSVQAGVPGGLDDADVGVEVFMDDVFTKPGLADYTGELSARVALQITDKDNTPHPGGPGAATTTSIPLTATATCAATAATNEGSTCSATTSLDALVPGTVKEGRRSIWQLGRVELYDGGPDGDVQTPAGDTLLATQGIFIP